MESAVADQPIAESSVPAPAPPAVDPVPAPTTPDQAPAPEPDPALAPDPGLAAPEPEPAPADVPPGDEPAAVAGVVFEPERVTTIVVTQYTRRDDSDVLPGHFGRVEAGEHAGEIGVFESVAADGPDGFPALVNVTLRDSGERIVCSYGDLTPAPFGGR